MSRKPTLAEINNNPLNIRYNPANNWQGQTGENKGFCTFKNEAYGIRAGYKILCNYIRNGHNTIERIIHRWAPPSENNTDKYIRFVCQETFISMTEPLGWESMHDYWTIIMILQAMAQIECGKKYDEQTINLYINYPEKY